MKKSLGIVILVVVLIGGGYFIYQNKEAQAPTENTQNPSNQTTPTPAPTPAPQAQVSPTPPPPTPTPPPGSTFSDEDDIAPAPDIQVVEVAYDGKAFTPGTVNIKVNDYVIFKNNSDTDFWPASAPHPAHTNYPEFDAKKAIAPGGKFQFQFTKEGSWAYHDHLNPTVFGKVNVTK